MKTIFLILFACFINSTWATNYYFSSISGDDSRTSTQAKSSSTPWKTLTKLNSFFSSLQPGDSILLKRGEKFYGSITITKSGTSSLPIVISAYGTGSRPIITSLVTLTNWVSKSNGIYESYNSSLGSTLNTVLLNGVEQQLGRYPNSNATDNGYLTFESHVGKTSITDNQFTSAINWAGAEVVIRSRRWVLDRGLINSNSGSTISYTGSSIYEPYDNYGYFIQNSLKTLDKFGEWYYSPSTKKVSIYFGSNNPSSYTIEATTKDNLIFSANYGNVVFDNLTIKGANGKGFNIASGSNIDIKNCDILFSGQDGVIVNGHANFKIENCIISNSNNNAIKLASGDNNATVRNNKILNTSLIAGMGVTGNANGLAIYTNGDNNIIEYNEIRNTGHIGISFKGNNVTIKNNYIDSFCLTKDDGSGIYFYADYVAYTGSRVMGNIVMNGIGAIAGTGNSIYSTSGIYFDHNISKVEVLNNTLVNCHDYGIYIHSASNVTLKNNTLYNNSKQQLNMTQAPAYPGTVRNNIIKQNIFFAKLPAQYASFLSSGEDDITYFGSFDSNYYARPIDDRITINNTYPGVTTNFDLAGWKKQYGDDPASKITAKQIAAYKLNSLIGSNKVTNGTFTSSVTGVSTSSCTISLSTSGSLDGGYLQVVPSATKSSVSMKIGGLTSGKKYILKYSLKGSADNNMSITTYLRQSVSPYSALTSKLARKVSTARSENEIIFLATGTESSASVLFQVDKQSKYYLDNIQVFEADASITNPDDSIKFLYNKTKANKSITLDGNYIDTKGNKFSNSITLLPYTSAVLIKNGGTTSTNKAPTVSITNPVTNAQFDAPASITISATATDADGFVIKVDFYNGSTLLGSDNTSPYSFTWNSVAAGNYSLTAKATDNGSLVTTSSAVAISVVNLTGAPTVGITSPANNAKFDAPASITISATAADADGSISKVEFYSGTSLLHTEYTAPYEWAWQSIPAGNYSLTARATDNNSLVTTSSAVNVSVVNPNVAPTVGITSPVNNAKFDAPASITINATAADADGSITKVDFYNGSTLLGSDNTSPYSFTWSSVAAGNYYLTAKATDNGFLVTTSSAIAVSVVNTNVAPSVSITSPANNAIFEAPASITISAKAADADGSVTKVNFYNGSTLLGSDNTSPYSFTWNSVAAGNYYLTAKATDNGSLVTSSPTVIVSVINPGAPIVSITNPIANTKFNAPATIAISATATVDHGTIRTVEFYKGSTLLYTATKTPYSWSWQNVPAGNYTLTAKATDNNGLTTTSVGVPISVVSNTLARSTISSPDTTSIIEESDTITITDDLTNALNKQKFSNDIINFKVYPNPCFNDLYVFNSGLQQNKKLIISIFSVSGNLIKTIQPQTANRVIKINISSFKNGVYIIKAISGNRVLSKQFVKL